MKRESDSVTLLRARARRQTNPQPTIHTGHTPHPGPHTGPQLTGHTPTAPRRPQRPASQEIAQAPSLAAEPTQPAFRRLQRPLVISARAAHLPAVLTFSPRPLASVPTLQQTALETSSPPSPPPSTHAPSPPSLVPDTMATTATSTKPRLDALQTPVSATYPSELRSPMVGTPTFIKKEEGLKTPITPPAAYLDFLRTLSPALMSPMTSASRMSFGDSFVVPASQPHARPHSVDFVARRPSPPSPPTEPAETGESTEPAEQAAATDSGNDSEASKPASPAVRPVVPASRSDSIASVMTVSSTASDDSTAKPTMKIIIPPVPPSPFTRPHSARTPRGRVQNPMSPFSPQTARTPLSATSARSPLTAHSAIYSPYSSTSPREWDFEKRDNQNGKGVRQVSVRQVVTRTVMYTRAPVVDPVPASKRRKTEHSSSASTSSTDSS